MEYFESVSSIEELKADYLNYLKKWKNNLEIMQEVNEQYQDMLFNLGVELNNKIEIQNKELSEENQKERFEPCKDKFAETLNQIIEFNMDIEIIGQWIWCFNSKEYHNELKELGFWYSANKKAWVYSGTKKKLIRSRNTIDSIRKKWGTEKVKEKEA